MTIFEKAINEVNKEIEKELKTLKDLRSNIDGLLSESELKAEAVKWIKECQACKDEKWTCISCNNFKKFFNLTEEDLEGGK